MKFYILKSDYSSDTAAAVDGSCRISEGTSVAGYKQWFLGCVKELGQIVPVDEGIKEAGLSRLLSRRDAVFLSINTAARNIDWRKVRFRLLQLTRGSLLLPENIFRIKILPSAQVQLVSTPFQRDRLRLFLGGLVPRMEVFAPEVDTGFYVPPDTRQRASARRKYGISKKQVHIVYAGRWVVTKGICQLMRLLDIWPAKGVAFTMAGSIENENPTFPRFLQEEVLRSRQRPWLRLQSAKFREELRELFWSADFFVNPSVHPDENFGITPRQACACGVGVVTTNFCGLRALAEAMPWKGVDTYPAPTGCRFSLKVFRDRLRQAVASRRLFSESEYHRIIAVESNVQAARANLKKAVDYLAQRPAENACGTEEIEAAVREKLFMSVNAKLLRQYLSARRELPRGAYAYGDEPLHPAFTMAQGMFSGQETAPQVSFYTRWRGFFRVALLPQENALVEWGIPGPRFLRYAKGRWNALQRCAEREGKAELVFMPRSNEQAAIIQELVDLGYLVAD